MPHRALRALSRNSGAGFPRPSLASLAIVVFAALPGALRSQTYEASSYARDNLAPKLAFDGDDDTRWSAAFDQKKAWIQVSHGAPARYAEVRLFSGIQDLKGAPRDFDILAGDLGELKLVKEVKNNKAGDVTVKFEARAARVWRIEIKTVVNEAWSPTLSGITFGPAATATQPTEAATTRADRTITASSPGTGTSTPDKAFDGDRQTHYQASEKGQEVWLAVSYTQPQTFRSARLYVHSEGGVGVPRDFMIQAKQGALWTTLAKVENGYAAEPVLLFKPSSAKEWRLLVTALVTDKPLQIAELELSDQALAIAERRAPSQIEVNKAIERGVSWLQSKRGADGNWKTAHTDAYPMGVMALGGLALLKSGVEAEQAPHPDLVERLGKMDVARQKTYSVALYVSYLRALSIKKHGDRIGACASFLIDHQGPDGLWGYPEGRTDLSNAQFALLGLKAAAEAGVQVPAKTWSRTLDYLLSGAEKDGGFNYVPTGKSALDPSTGSMTAAALACLKVCADFLPKDPAAEDRAKAVRDKAFEWLDQRFVVEMNPGSEGSHYYYLYAIERLGAFYDRREIGGRNWYHLGARHLLDWQRKDGSWHRNVEDTCFALLFLNRASVSAK
jgi:F5/8 type C domain